MTHPEAPLGEFRFSTGKSHLRLSGWTLLILAPIALFLLAARGNIDNLTGNQIAIGIFLLVMIAAMLLNFLFTRIDVYSNALVQKRFFSKHTFYFSGTVQILRMAALSSKFPVGRTMSYPLVSPEPSTVLGKTRLCLNPEVLRGVLQTHSVQSPCSPSCSCCWGILCILLTSSSLQF